jgi:hypothetical protein
MEFESILVSKGLPHAEFSQKGVIDPTSLSAVASDTTLGLLARNDFRVARDLGVVERMLPSQVRAAIFTVGLPRPRCTEDTGSGC